MNSQSKSDQKQLSLRNILKMLNANVVPYDTFLTKLQSYGSTLSMPYPEKDPDGEWILKKDLKTLLKGKVIIEVDDV